MKRRILTLVIAAVWLLVGEAALSATHKAVIIYGGVEEPGHGWFYATIERAAAKYCDKGYTVIRLDWPTKNQIRTTLIDNAADLKVFYLAAHGCEDADKFETNPKLQPSEDVPFDSLEYGSMTECNRVSLTKSSFTRVGRAGTGPRSMSGSSHRSTSTGILVWRTSP